MPWTEVIIPVELSPDEGLLLDQLNPLIAELRPSLVTWHFFWEPDLWVRLEWRSDPDKRVGERLIGERLDGWVEAGRLPRWRFGEYGGDAEMMGAELWPLFARDFMHNAELAIAVLTHERAHTLTKNRGFHWARRVHVFSNVLVGTWAEEARLSLLQASYRLRLLARMNGEHTDELAECARQVDAVVASISGAEPTEQAFLRRWREMGRPDLASLLSLPPDFDRDPGRSSA